MGKEKKNPVKIIEKLRIRKDGTFNYREIHHYINDWFMKHGYSYAETKHAEKSKDSGRDIESEWSGSRKVTGYIKFRVDIVITAKDYKDLVLEQNSEKVKTGVGRLEILFNASMEKNYFKETMEKYVMHSNIKNYEEKLEAEALGLYEMIKDLAG